MSPYALILNLTFSVLGRPGAANAAGPMQPVMTVRFGLPNGPSNPTGGFGVPQNGTIFALTRCRPFKTPCLGPRLPLPIFRAVSALGPH
jgi:hypothetical protein